MIKRDPLQDPTRLLIAGDTHGNTAWVESLIESAVGLGCELILQLGDFGYWPHEATGRRFLFDCETLAAEAEVPIVWIDGNHENHSYLRGLPPRADGFVEISQNVLHAPRGARWEWSGVRFGALGGAFSIDWRTRKVGSSWWPDEDLTREDVERLGDEPVDVLLTHDAPMEVPLVGMSLRADDEAKAQTTKRLISEAVARTNPKLLMHGHWHHRYSHRIIRRETTDPAEIRWLSTRVEGLASDMQGDGGAWGVLELPSLNFVDGTTIANARL